MKKLFVLFLILPFFIVSGNLFPQTGWYIINSGISYNLNSVHFTDSLTGMAVSSAGQIIKSTDGGTNWTLLNSGIQTQLLDIKLNNNIIAYASGDNGVIIRTSNGGANWYSVYSGSSNYSVRNLQFYGDTGFAFVKYLNFPYGDPIKTLNGGLSWSWTGGPAMVYPLSSSFINAKTGYMTGYYLYQPPPPPPISYYYQYTTFTTSCGSGWTTYTNSTEGTYVSNNIYFHSYNTGIKIRIPSSGTHSWYYTTSGGQLWNSLTRPVDYTTTVFFLNPQRAYCTGYNSPNLPLIGKSTNGGFNWTTQNAPVMGTLNKVFFINENTGWIACSGGIILKTIDGGVTPINAENELIPGEYSLKQNFPNPFNSSTKIFYGLPAAGNVKLVIFDIQGREITVLVNEQRSAGTYETVFDASSLPSGIYYYTLKAGEFSVTRKMVLIK